MTLLNELIAPGYETGWPEKSQKVLARKNAMLRFFALDCPNLAVTGLIRAATIACAILVAL